MRALTTILVAAAVTAIARPAEAKCGPMMTLGTGHGDVIPPTGVVFAVGWCGGEGVQLVDGDGTEWTATQTGTYAELRFRGLPAGTAAISSPVHRGAAAILRVDPAWRKPALPPALIAVERSVDDFICSPTDDVVFVLDRGAAGLQVSWLDDRGAAKRLRVPVMRTENVFRAAVTLRDRANPLHIDDAVVLHAIEADGSLTPITGGSLRLDGVAATEPVAPPVVAAPAAAAPVAPAHAAPPAPRCGHAMFARLRGGLLALSGLALLVAAAAYLRRRGRNTPVP